MRRAASANTRQPLLFVLSARAKERMWDGTASMGIGTCERQDDRRKCRGPSEKAKRLTTLGLSTIISLL